MTKVPDPIEDNQSRVLVRQTASGFEQGIAAVAGLLTAGPIGALASWGTIRGVQGKWTPWFVLGVPAIVIINFINMILLGMIVSDGEDNQSFNFKHHLQMATVERIMIIPTMNSYIDS